MSTSKRLVAALACRVQGARLYGKPLQNLNIDNNTTILDHIIQLIQTIPVIDEAALAIADGPANTPFVDIAKRYRIRHVIGSEHDVLLRLIECGRAANATDIFRITTESPFFFHEMVEEAYRHHVRAANDVTVIDGVPDGCHFEIYTMDALEKSHHLGEERHRSEYCSLYIREHSEDFRIEVLPIPPGVERLDLRLTVDFPEDLVLCRHIYATLKHKAPRIPLEEIVEFIDRHPKLQALVAPHVTGQRYW